MVAVSGRQGGHPSQRPHEHSAQRMHTMDCHPTVRRNKLDVHITCTLTGHKSTVQIILNSKEYNHPLHISKPRASKMLHLLQAHTHMHPAEMSAEGRAREGGLQKITKTM